MEATPVRQPMLVATSGQKKVDIVVECESMWTSKYLMCKPQVVNMSFNFQLLLQHGFCESGFYYLILK